MAIAALKDFMLRAMFMDQRNEYARIQKFIEAKLLPIPSHANLILSESRILSCEQCRKVLSDNILSDNSNASVSYLLK